MEGICRRRSVTATEDALSLIAKMADGSVRDALSLLEQCMAAGDLKIDKSLVLEYTGCAGDDFYNELTKAVLDSRIGDALSSIDDILSDGKDSKQVIKDWLEHYRNIMICRYVKEPEKILRISKENADRLKAQAENIDSKQIENAIRLLSEFVNLARYSDRPRILLETAAVKLSSGELIYSDIEKKASVSKSKIDKMSAIEYNARKEPENNHKELQPQIEVTKEEIRLEVPKQDEETEAINRSLAQATTGTGEPASMWKAIAEEVGKTSRPVGMLATRNSQALSYKNNELIVVIRKSKIAFAESASDEINRVAKDMFGKATFVTLRAGEPEEQASSIANGKSQDGYEGNSEEFTYSTDSNAARNNKELEESTNTIQSFLKL